MRGFDALEEREKAIGGMFPNASSIAYILQAISEEEVATRCFASALLGLIGGPKGSLKAEFRWL